MFSVLYRGYVYSRNLELGPGKVACGHKLLIYRPSAFDNESENSNFCQILDPSSLKVNTTDIFSSNNILLPYALNQIPTY